MNTSEHLNLSTAPVILDIDLDFFVEPMWRGTGSLGHRYERDDIKIVAKSDALNFMRLLFRLKTSAPIVGAKFERHVEVFHELERLIDGEIITPPFRIVHLDAHDDLGGRNDKGPVNSANFLMHCIGRDWVEHLDLILHPFERWRGDQKVLKFGDIPKLQFDGHECTVDFPTIETFRLSRPPDRIFLTRSPEFTPEAADSLYEALAGFISVPST